VWQCSRTRRFWSPRVDRHQPVWVEQPNESVNRRAASAAHCTRPFESVITLSERLNVLCVRAQRRRARDPRGANRGAVEWTTTNLELSVLNYAPWPCLSSTVLPFATTHFTVYVVRSYVHALCFYVKTIEYRTSTDVSLDTCRTPNGQSHEVDLRWTLTARIGHGVETKCFGRYVEFRDDAQRPNVTRKTPWHVVFRSSGRGT